MEIGPGRFRALAATTRPLLDPGSSGAMDTAEAVAAVGDLLHRVLRPLAGQRVAHRALVGAGPPDADRTRPTRSRPEPQGLDLGLEAAGRLAPSGADRPPRRPPTRRWTRW